MEIVKNVFSIKLLFNRAFLLVGKHLTLIDTGFPCQAKRIIHFIRSIGRKPDELTLIILTHHHIDHKGNARALKKLTGAKIAAHSNDAPIIEGKEHSYKMNRSWWVKLLLFVTELVFRKESVKVNKKLKNGDIIDNLVVYHTPGHTKGSISLYLKNRKLLFCGDTVPYTLGKLKKPNPYTINHNKEFESLKKLSELEFDMLLPNDCRMVLNHGKKSLVEFCSK